MSVRIRDGPVLETAAFDSPEYIYAQFHRNENNKLSFQQNFVSHNSALT